MCWLFTYFLVPIQNELRVICEGVKKYAYVDSVGTCSAAIFPFTFMKTLFTSTATAYRILVALIYIPLESSLSEVYTVCLIKDIVIICGLKIFSEFACFCQSPGVTFSDGSCLTLYSTDTHFDTSTTGSF